MGRRSQSKRQREADAEERERKVRALWEMVPKIECKGLCSNSCGPIDMSDVERRLISEQGLEIPGMTCLTCPALDFAGRCRVYDIRPMICRLWGVTETMKCPHGCVPEGGHMPDDEGHLLIAESLRIGGSNLVQTPEQVAQYLAYMDSPMGRRYLEEVVAKAPDFKV